MCDLELSLSQKLVTNIQTKKNLFLSGHLVWVKTKSFWKMADRERPHQLPRCEMFASAGSSSRFKVFSEDGICKQFASCRNHTLTCQECLHLVASGISWDFFWGGGISQPVSSLNPADYHSGQMGRKTPWSFFFSSRSYLVALKTGKNNNMMVAGDEGEGGGGGKMSKSEKDQVGRQVFFFRGWLFSSLPHRKVQRVTALFRATQLVSRLLFSGVPVTEESYFGWSSCCSASRQTAPAVAVAASTLLVAVRGTPAWQKNVCVARTRF